MISVIMPIYKTEKHLRKSIDSIINQTYKDLEIILVDDGSPDNCGKICDEYANKDARVKVIHKENGGRSSARNAGLEAVTGEYFAFVDSDDWLDEDCYETILKIAEETNADIAEFSFRFFRPWKNQNKILARNDTKQVMEYTNAEALERLYFGPQTLSDISISVCNKLYRTNRLSSLKFSEGYDHEDVEYTAKILHSASKVVKYDCTFYTYNIHLSADSITGMKINAKKVWDGIYMRQRVAEFFEQNKVEKISDYTMRAYYNALISGYCECSINGKDGDFKKLKKYLKGVLRKNKQDICAKGGRKNQLFFFSSSLYVAMVWSKRKAKKIKYKIRVKLTGRN